LHPPLFRDRQPDHDKNHLSARLAYSALAFALTLLTGCALIQDDPGQVPLVNPQQAELAQVIHLANSGWPTARWWEGYQDPQLNMLVNRALQNSPPCRLRGCVFRNRSPRWSWRSRQWAFRPPPWRRKTACG
jgi:hypothetical protein